MPEIIIKYKNRKALEALKDLSKYLDFTILKSNLEGKSTIPKISKLNGITIVPGNDSIDTLDLTTIFTGKNIDSQKLRDEAWQRRK